MYLEKPKRLGMLAKWQNHSLWHENEENFPGRESEDCLPYVRRILMSQFMEILSLETNGKKKSKTGTKKWEMELKYKSLNAYHIVPSKFTRQVLSLHSMKLRPRRVKELDQVQLSSVAQSCLTLCDSMNHSTPGLPVHHQLPESTQTHIHWVGDAIQPSHPLSSPSPPALNLAQHQGIFKWVSSSHQVAKVLEFQPQHQSFQWTPTTDLL